MTPTHTNRARGWLVLAASMGLHALLLVLIPEPKPPAPRPEPTPPPVAIEIIDVPDIAFEEAPPEQAAAEPASPPVSEPVAEPQPAPAVAESLATESPAAEPEAAEAAADEPQGEPLAQGDDLGADSDSPSPEPSGPVETVDGGRRDPGEVRLFDSTALGDSVGSWKREVDDAAARAERRQVDPNSALAEASRVTGRVVKAVAKAEAMAQVAGGFRSSCDDGVDNDNDGLIDCADPACRKRRECAGTGVYEQTPWMDIPEADDVGLSSIISVTQDGTVKKLSVRIQVQHSSPGDMTMLLENVETGKSVVLHQADRSDSTIEPAFLLHDFNGTPAKGKWRLRIRDEYAGARGKLKKWWLYVTS